MMSYYASYYAHPGIFITGGIILGVVTCQKLIFSDKIFSADVNNNRAISGGILNT